MTLLYSLFAQAATLDSHNLSQYATLYMKILLPALLPIYYRILLRFRLNGIFVPLKIVKLIVQFAISKIIIFAKYAKKAFNWLMGNAINVNQQFQIKLLILICSITNVSSVL